MSMLKKIIARIYSGTPQETFVIIILFIFLVAMVLTSVRDHEKNKLLVMDWQQNGAIIRYDIAKLLAREIPGKTPEDAALINVKEICNVISKYCAIIDEKNDKTIWVRKDQDDVNSEAFDLGTSRQLCMRCSEKKISKTPYDLLIEEHGSRPKKHWYYDYPIVLKAQLLRKINNPDSLQDLDCFESDLMTNGWETMCDFRMANKYGGLEKYRVSFLISKGFVSCIRNCDEIH